MTEFFAYENLTWPEVAALPRHTPLVLPLGTGFPLERLASALGNPPQCGLLPPLPYGWCRSSLPLPEPVLAAYVTNLLDSLRDDGFSNLYALTPQEVKLNLGAAQMALPTSTALRPAFFPLEADRSKVVVIPIGHTEQHAHHLPLSTDTLIIAAIGQGTAAAIPSLAVTLPVMPYGVSTHRSSYAGTLNAGGRAFEDFFLSTVDTLVWRGFERFFLLSGHGGNCSFLTNVVKYAGERYPYIFCATTFLYLSSPQGIEALQSRRRSGIGGMGHACELETSIILALHPDLAHMERVVDEIDFISTPSYYMDWVEGGALIANPPWEDDTATGAYGAGSLATVENGRLWLQAAIEEKAAQVREIHEQYTRRRERRLRRAGISSHQPPSST